MPAAAVAAAAYVTEGPEGADPAAGPDGEAVARDAAEAGAALTGPAAGVGVDTEHHRAEGMLGVGG